MGFSDDQYRNSMMRYLKSIDISLGRIASALEDINTVYQNRGTNEIFLNPFNPVYASKSVIDAINSVPNDEFFLQNPRSCSFCKNGVNGEWDLRLEVCHTCGKEHENFDPIERK